MTYHDDRVTRELDALNAHEDDVARQGEPAVPTLSASLAELADDLKAKSDSAYSRYIEAMRLDDCLRLDLKLQRGTFGKQQLNAFTAAHELLGAHEAFGQAAAMLRDRLREVEGTPPPVDAARGITDPAERRRVFDAAWHEALAKERAG